MATTTVSGIVVPLSAANVFRISQIATIESIYLSGTSAYTAITTFSNTPSQTTNDLYTLQSGINGYMSTLTTSNLTLFGSAVRVLLSVENEITSAYLNFLNTAFGTAAIATTPVLGSIPSSTGVLESILALLVNGMGSTQIAPTNAVNVTSCYLSGSGSKALYVLNQTIYTTGNDFAHYATANTNCGLFSSWTIDHHISGTGLVADCTGLIPMESVMGKCISFYHA